MTDLDTGEQSGHKVARVLALVLGALLSLVALSLVIAGATLLIGQTVLDEDGFITARDSLSTDSYALVSEPFEVSGIDEIPFADSPPELRLAVDGDKAVFVGVAPADEAERALGGIERDLVRGDQRAGVFGNDLQLERAAGAAPQVAPAELLDWEASASGREDVTTTWEPRDGEWVVVAMNADGSAGIDLDGAIGARIPFLRELGWGIVAFGVLVGLMATALILAGTRRSRTQAAAVTPPGDAGGASIPAAVAVDQEPVRVRAVVDPNVGRWLWLVKWVLLIPHYIALAFLYAAFVIVTVVAWFAIVFTGRYPRSLFDFNVGVLRWQWRVNGYSYGAFATDRYPPFSLAEHPDYPVSLEIDYPEQLSRGLAFVKWLLAMPHLVLIGAAAGGVVIGGANREANTEIGVVGLLVLFLGVALLFTGRVPSGVFDLMVGIQRWILRTVAYVALMTDHYPPFRLDQGGDEPAPAAPPSPSGNGSSRTDTVPAVEHSRR